MTVVVWLTFIVVSIDCFIGGRIRGRGRGRGYNAESFATEEDWDDTSSKISQFSKSKPSGRGSDEGFGNHRSKGFGQDDEFRSNWKTGSGFGHRKENIGRSEWSGGRSEWSGGRSESRGRRGRFSERNDTDGFNQHRQSSNRSWSRFSSQDQETESQSVPVAPRRTIDWGAIHASRAMVEAEKWQGIIFEVQ